MLNSGYPDFLRSRPTKVNTICGKGILFKFKTLTSLFTESEYLKEEEEEREELKSIIINKPNIIYVPDDCEQSEDDEPDYHPQEYGELYCNKSHPNVERNVSFLHRGQSYMKACLGSFVIRKNHEPLPHNLLAGKIYEYITSFNDSGYRSSLQSHADNRYRCYFCKRLNRKIDLEDIDIYNISQLKSKPQIPCYACGNIKVKLTSQSLRLKFNKEYLSVWYLLCSGFDIKNICVNKEDASFSCSEA